LGSTLKEYYCAVNLERRKNDIYIFVFDGCFDIFNIYYL